QELHERERRGPVPLPPIESVALTRDPATAPTLEPAAPHAAGLLDGSGESDTGPGDSDAAPRGFGRALALSLCIGACGAAFALAARALTVAFAGPLPYDDPGALHTVLLAALGAIAAVVVTVVGSESDVATPPPVTRFRRSTLAAAPFAAAAIGFGFLVQGARDEARGYDGAEHSALELPALERRAAARETHAMTQFSLGAAYLREHRYLDAETRLAYAYALDPRNLRAAELRAHAITAMTAQRPPAVNDARLEVPGDSIAMAVRIGRYYAALYAAGDHSGEVYEGILAGLRFEKRYRDAINVAELYLREHPGDPLWTARIAELRAVRAREPLSDRGSQPTGAPVRPNLSTMRGMVPHQPADAFTEASFAYEYLKSSIGQPLFHPDSLLAAADLHTRRAMALAPRSAPYRVQLGLIRFLAGDFRGCDSAFSAATRLDPHALDGQPDKAELWRIARAHLDNVPAPKLTSIRLVPPPRP
ncbi:MAG TPA: hypothetical protein VHM30_07030, partial [Gemmatimonadaceae bacterium]|nr:hypothetical protein [Gemmatimonadaceae bacterium]